MWAHSYGAYIDNGNVMNAEFQFGHLFICYDLFILYFANEDMTFAQIYCNSIMDSKYVTNGISICE